MVVDGVVYGFPPHVRLVDLLGDGNEALAEQAERVLRSPAVEAAIEAVDLLPPVPVPPSVRDFYAFEGHVRTARAARGLEMDPDWYELPVFYFSNPHALVGHGATVTIPSGCRELDYELEVAAVIGRGGADLDPDEARDHIAGFTIMNDWSARDIQRQEMRLGLGPAKGKDFATGLGPFIVTPDELAPLAAGKAYDLAMTARVNDIELSRGLLADIHWSFGEMIAYASRGTGVEPGDVIGSGTCGTGCLLELRLTGGEDAHPWLRAGDTVTLAVEHLGELTNTVVQ